MTTDLHRAEANLRGLLAAIVESSDDAIISKTLAGVITSWNRGAQRIFGYSAEEVVGKHISLLMPPERIEDLTHILERVRRGEQVDHYETKRRTKDDRIIDVSLTVSPIRDADGNIIGASKVARDITEQKRAAMEREEAEFRSVLESAPDAIVIIDGQGASSASIGRPRRSSTTPGRNCSANPSKFWSPSASGSGTRSTERPTVPSPDHARWVWGWSSMADARTGASSP